MFESSLLKGAIAALYFLDKAEAIITTSTEDKTMFPDFAAAMESSGNFAWKSHSVISNGYNLKMFQIIGDDLGNELLGEKGSVMLHHGMYSDATDWLVRGTDITQSSTAMQLAAAGHDVWLTMGRGRQYSRTHLWLDPDSLDLAVRDLYWDYTFEDVGREDIPKFIDTILANRKLGDCNQVTVMPHGTGVNETLIAAINMPDFNDKVKKIVGLAPCLDVSTNSMVIDSNEPNTVVTLYALFKSYGISNIFAADYMKNLQAMCDEVGVGQFLCNTYFLPNPMLTDPFLYETGMSYYSHIQQNAVVDSFQEYVELPQPDPVTQQVPTVDLRLAQAYDLGVIGVPVSILAGSDDVRCPAELQLPYFSDDTLNVENSFTQVLGGSHEDFLIDNRAAFVDAIEAELAQVKTPIDPMVPAASQCRTREYKDSERKRMAEFEQLKDDLFAITNDEDVDLNGDGIADVIDDEEYWKMCQFAKKKEQELADRGLPGTLGFECDQSRIVYGGSQEKRMAEFEVLRDELFAVTNDEASEIPNFEYVKMCEELEKKAAELENKGLPADLNGFEPDQDRMVMAYNGSQEKRMYEFEVLRDELFAVTNDEASEVPNFEYVKMCEQLEKKAAELESKGLPADLNGFEPDQDRMVMAYNGTEEKRMYEFEAMKANLFAMTNDEPCDLDGDGIPDEYNEEDLKKMYQETVKKAFELDQRGLPGDLADYDGAEVIMPIFQANGDYEKKTTEYEKKLSECLQKVDEVLDSENPDKAREMLKKIKEVFFKMDEMCIEHDDLEDFDFYEDLMDLYNQKF